MFQKVKWMSITWMFVVLFTFAMQVPIFANTKVPEAINDSASGVLQLIFSYVDESGNTYYIHQGTGIFVGKSRDQQYIITDQQLVTATSDEVAQIRKWNGLSSETNLTPQIQILLEPDILVTASIVSKGNQLPYALLTPDTSLQNISPIPISGLAKTTAKQSVYLCGHVMDMSILGQKDFSSTELSYLSGRTTNVDATVDTIACDIETETGCSGAPLLDESGNLLAMCYFSGTNLELLSADSLCSVLDSFNITYTTTDSNANYNVADDAIKQQLQVLLTECQSDVTLHEDSYTKKSLNNYKTAINTAMSVLSSDSSTKDDYQNSIDELTKTKHKLKPYNHTFHIIEGILFLLIGIFGCINIRQYVTSRSLKQLLHPAKHTTEDSATHMAALIRSDTKEVIWLDQKQLRIGKDSKQVDYCIEDRTSISRYHAAIVYRDNQYYLVDNHSTNHTFRNHSMIAPQSAVLLADGDSIAFADVAFQFRVLRD